MKRSYLTVIVLLFCVACKTKVANRDARLLTDEQLLHNNMHQLTQVIINDMFSPPVSGRIYTYTSMAAYEALRFQKPGYPSFAPQMHLVNEMPLVDTGLQYNYLLAATSAFFTVATKLTFSADTLNNYRNSVFESFKDLLPADVYDRSEKLGQQVGAVVLERASKDKYKETRGMPKFIGATQPGHWTPTAPDYMEASEPNWEIIAPIVIDSATQFKCAPPFAYNMQKSSDFYKSLFEVYTISKNLTDEQRTIARYWDDNPFVTEHAGHTMYGTKKITPVGHWIGICGIACKMNNTDAVETARSYLLTSAAMFDAIITCWHEKYHRQQIRPITVINEKIDRDWQPFLQTPAFPEHTSGHSSISASAATVLTHLFGDNFAFTDTSDLAYIGLQRNFSSFNNAALEASISRVYGGIHYRRGIDAGADQGRMVGEYVYDKLLQNQKEGQKQSVANAFGNK